MNERDSYEIEDKFAALEERIMALESMVDKLLKNGDTKSVGFAEKPDASSFNALGIATVAQIYMANRASNRSNPS